jgi:UDPglucose 6-dehydrogenase
MSVYSRFAKSGKNKNITIIGTGYVGLVTGACFADLGQKVICIDKDKEKIEKLKKGKVPIYEPGLSAMVKKNIQQGKLFFENNLTEPIQNSKIIFICVGTPSARNGKADLSFIENAAQEIGENIKEPKIIVAKSTVPVGTGKNLIAKIISKYWKGNFEVASNPEFLREGTGVSDFLNPDRIIIGVNSSKAGKILLELYKKINCPKIVTTLESAEMIKYASNAFLATKISFINEIANLCESADADVEEVAKGVGSDKRIGEHFLKPGIGWGGSCFPKDVKALRQMAGANGYNFRLLKSTIEANNYQRKRIIEKIKDLFSNREIKNKTVAVLGLAFKANTDDIRESAAIEIIKKLQKASAKIKTYDPKAMENAKKILNNKIKFYNSPYETAKNADILLIATEWDEFKKLNWQKIKDLLKKPIIIDGRNLLNPIKMKKMGFNYICVGRNIL